MSKFTPTQAPIAKRMLLEGATIKSYHLVVLNDPDLHELSWSTVGSMETKWLITNHPQKWSILTPLGVVEAIKDLTPAELKQYEALSGESNLSESNVKSDKKETKSVSKTSSIDSLEMSVKYINWAGKESFFTLTKQSLEDLLIKDNGHYVEIV